MYCSYDNNSGTVHTSSGQGLTFVWKPLLFLIFAVHRQKDARTLWSGHEAYSGYSQERNVRAGSSGRVARRGQRGKSFTGKSRRLYSQRKRRPFVSFYGSSSSCSYPTLKMIVQSMVMLCYYYWSLTRI